ncbi:transposase [Streptomyces peucetius]|nr:IS5/IS1182 family transposase [Streptomyces peucetius subsp. caesius ATCC 27952]
MGRGDLCDAQWTRLEPHLPKNVGRGGRWKCHHKVINGILFRQRTGIPWRNLPTRFGKWRTCHDRHRRWSADGTWEKVLRAVQTDAEGRIDWSMVGIDSTTCRPLAVLITPGPWADAPQPIPVLERVRVPRAGDGHPLTRPDHLSGDKAYSSRRNRRYLRRRQIKHTIPEPRSQRANRQHRGSRGVRPTGFDKSLYKRRNEVERTVNALEESRAVATRYDKRAYVFHGTVTLAAIRLWLR